MDVPIPVKIKSMPMSKTTPAVSTVLPQIEPSDLETVRRFLTASRDEERRSARPIVLPGEVKGGPTVSHGITRARFRSSKAAAGN